MEEHKDTTIQVIAERISSLHGDVTELRTTMKDSMKEMSAAVTKLVQIEVNQMYMNQSYERLNVSLEKSNLKYETLEKRMDDIEKEQPLTKQIVKWVVVGITALITGIVGYALKTIGIF